MLSAKMDYHSMKENTLPSPPMNSPQEYLMTLEQKKYCTAIMRTLKRHRDAAPFLNPVNHVKDNVPDYPSVVTQPMHLLLVDQKLNDSEYATVDDFVSDVKLIFSNCFKFNGSEATLSVLCQNMESAFEKSLRQMPVSPTTTVNKELSPVSNIKKELSPPLSQHNSPPPPQNDFFSYKPIEELGRPKREIHCPSKDYPETYTSKRKNSHVPLQLKFCHQALRELKKNKYRDLVYPFLTPVDPIALNLPDYTTIVQHPMDLSTIENKLLNGEYDEPEQFEEDMTLMFNNCYLYNPPTLPIYSATKNLEKVFRNKWQQRSLVEEKENHAVSPSAATRITSSNSSSATQHVRRKSTASKSTKSSVPTKNEMVDTRDDKIAELERTIASISQQIESIKYNKKQPATAAATRKRRSGSNEGANTKSAPAAKRKRTIKKKIDKHRANDHSEDDEDMVEEEGLDEFTFEEKKELSERINQLTGDCLSTVVSIIQNSLPDLTGDTQEGEEITLDVDSLDIRTLHKLSNFVEKQDILQRRKAQRTHYTAKAATHKIRQLEKTLKKFDIKEERSASSESESDDDSSSSSSGSDSD